MAQTVIRGTSGSFSASGQAFGGRIAMWEAVGTYDENDATGFSSSGNYEWLPGIFSLEGTAAGVLTQSTTNDQPLAGGQTTTTITFVLTANSGCTYTFSGFLKTESLTVSIRDNGRIAFRFKASGTVTKAWVTS